MWRLGINSNTGTLQQVFALRTLALTRWIKNPGQWIKTTQANAKWPNIAPIQCYKHTNTHTCTHSASHMYGSLRGLKNAPGCPSYTARCTLMKRMPRNKTRLKTEPYHPCYEDWRKEKIKRETPTSTSVKGRRLSSEKLTGVKSEACDQVSVVWLHPPGRLY